MRRWRSALAGIAAACTLASAGCGGDGPDSASTATGTIRGRCTVAAPVPRPRIQPGMMDGDAEVDSPRVETGDGLALANCVVWLPSVAGGKDWPQAMRAGDRTAWIDVRPGSYEPHVQWVRPGTRLGFRSALEADITVHAYRNTFADTQFDFALPPGAVEADVAGAFLEKPGIYWVTDDYRHGYTAYVHVVANPYVDTTSVVAAWENPAGAYVLSDVPPGDYDVVCWHEGMAMTVHRPGEPAPRYEYSPDVRLTQTARVEAGRTAVVDFVFPAPAK